MTLRTKYAVLKATTIVLGALSIPWSTFVGFCFGEGRYSIGVVALCVQTAVALVDGYIWFWVLENMKKRLDEESARPWQSTSKSVAARRQVSKCEVCGKLFSGVRAIFRCQCGRMIHAECWGQHVVESHCPSFELTYASGDDGLEATQPISSSREASRVKELVVAQTR